MSLARRREILPLLVLFLLLAAEIASGCVLPVGLSSPTPAPTPVPTARPVPTTPDFIPMTKPSATPTPVVTPAPEPASSEVIFEPNYKWEYKGVRWNFTMVIPESAYRYFRDKPRTPGMSYADYALADEDRETLQDVASRIKSRGDGQGYSDYDNAANVLTFVQSLPYSKDRDSVGVSEYPRYPLETLKDGTGDCEDKTILAAALLQQMGYDVVILILPDHAALGINLPGATGVSYEYKGKPYYYVEMTSLNWKIGEQPDEMRGAQAKVVPLEKAPIVGLDVTATSVSSDADNVYFRTQYTVKNAGPGTAHGLVLRVRAYDPGTSDNRTWPPERTIAVGDLAEGGSASGETMLTVPQGELGQITCELSGVNVETVRVSTDSFRAVR